VQQLRSTKWASWSSVQTFFYARTPARELLFETREEQTVPALVFLLMLVSHENAIILSHFDPTWSRTMSNKLAMAATLLATLIGPANAQQTTTGAATPVQGQVLNTLPANSTTVTNYYKQNVYDPSNTKIGEIADVLVSKDEKSRPSSFRLADSSELEKRT
jgi:hypothetical protein